MTQIHDRIRKILETTPGLTQRGLAEHMGVNPAAVNRMLHGQRSIMAMEVPLIESYLGVHLDLSAPVVATDIEYKQNPPHSGRRGFSDAPAQPLHPPSKNAAPVQMVPVYGYSASNMQKGLNLSGGEIVDWVVRHPAQYGSTNAFAIYVFSEEMEPRYFRGELIYIHPGRPPEINHDCLIEMKNGDAYIRRFMRQTATKIRAAQFNPAEENDIPKNDIKAIYAIVGRS